MRFFDFIKNLCAEKVPDVKIYPTMQEFESSVEPGFKAYENLKIDYGRLYDFVTFQDRPPGEEWIQYHWKRLKAAEIIRKNNEADAKAQEIRLNGYVLK